MKRHDRWHVVHARVSGQTRIGSIRVVQTRAVVAVVLVMEVRSEHAATSRQHITAVDGGSDIHVVRHLLAFVPVKGLVVLVIRRVTEVGILQSHPVEGSSMIIT